MSDTILEIVNLQKAYPGVVALDNVSMSFKRGEIHAIVGERRGEVDFDQGDHGCGRAR